MIYSNEIFYKEALEKMVELVSLMGKLLAGVNLNPSNSPHLPNTPYLKAALADTQSTQEVMQSLPADMVLVEEEMGERSDGTPYVSKQVYANAYQRMTFWYAEDGHITERNVKQLA